MMMAMMLLLMSGAILVSAGVSIRNNAVPVNQNVVLYIHVTVIRGIMFQGLVYHQMLTTMLLLALSVLQALTGVETCKNAVTLDRNVAVYLHAPIQCIMFQGLVYHQMLTTMLLLASSVLQALAGVVMCKNAATLDQNVAMYLHAQGLFQSLIGHQMLTTILLLALSVLQALAGVVMCKNAATLDQNVAMYLHAQGLFQGLVGHQMLITMLLLALSVLQALAGVVMCKNAATLDQNVAMYLHAQGLFQGLVGHQMLILRKHTILFLMPT